MTEDERNQGEQRSDTYEGWLNGLRLRIEGMFNEVQNAGKDLEGLLAKTVLGLCARIVAKMTSHLLRYILRCNLGIDVLPCSKVQA